MKNCKLKMKKCKLTQHNFHNETPWAVMRGNMQLCNSDGFRGD